MADSSWRARPSGSSTTRHTGWTLKSIYQFFHVVCEGKHEQAKVAKIMHVQTFHYKVAFSLNSDTSPLDRYFTQGTGEQDKHAASARIRVQVIEMPVSNLWLLVNQVVQDVPVFHDRASQVDQPIWLLTL